MDVNELGSALSSALNDIMHEAESHAVDLKVANGYLLIGSAYTCATKGRQITTDTGRRPWYFKIVGMLYNPATGKTIWDFINLNSITDDTVKQGVIAVTKGLSRR